MPVVLGIHGFSAGSSHPLHDTGVSLVVNGRVEAAVNEERLSRRKNDGSFPWKALESLKARTGLVAKEVDAVAMPDAGPLWQLREVVRLAGRVAREQGVLMGRYLADTAWRTRELRRLAPAEFARSPRILVRHHLAHAASAGLTSPWPRCTVVTLDGMGDYCEGGLVCRQDEGGLHPIARTNGFYSPGIFYMIVTSLLGYTPGRHEGKVTGLAAFGDPARLRSTMREVLWYRQGDLDFGSRMLPRAIDASRFTKGRVDGLQPFRALWDGALPEDLAAAAQEHLEAVVVPYVRDAVLRVGLPHVALAGGVFANVKLNQRIRELPDVHGVWVHPAMTDSGLATGAALHVERELAGKGRAPRAPHPLPHAFLGHEPDEAEILAALRGHKVETARVDDLVGRLVEALAVGQAVAVVRGAMEYGPRALGHRTILASPEDPGINDRLNARLKRTEFMPFAPQAARCFRGWEPDHETARFMTMTYDVSPLLRERAPAVVHVDGTARPQVVRPQDEPFIHEVLERWTQRTGIPVLINTSYNMHEEPIVCTAEDALRALEQGAVDGLVLGDWWVVARLNDGRSGLH